MPLDGLQLGHYQLLRLIGTGGMGEVYLAEDPRLRRQVAIKVVRTEVTPYPSVSTVQEAARLFQREAKAIAMLDHTSILPLYDYGEEVVNGTAFAYLVMPFRPEGSLANWLRERQNSELLSTQDVAHIVRQAASALQYAHDHQIVHQDVKPSNFLIRSNADNPGSPDLLLADFGVAKLSTATSSASHSVRGTPTYMAPEQWEGNPSPTTDQYSLAVMVYELLTGRPPFEGSPMRMMYLHAHVQPEPPSTLNPEIPKDMDTVLLHALAKKPAERFASIAAFSNAVQQSLPGAGTSTIIKTKTLIPAAAGGNELRATLAISEAEARNGGSRTLTLPGGRQVTVHVPAGTNDGQIIHLSGLDVSLDDGTSASTLILTITVLPTQELPAMSYTASGETFTPGGSRPGTSNTSQNGRQLGSSAANETPTLLPGSEQSSNKPRSHTRGRASVLIALALLILLPSAGLLYITITDQAAAHNAAATAQANNAANTQANNATASANDATAQAIHATSTTQANVLATTQSQNTLATAQANSNTTAQAKANATAQANVNATAQANTNATASAANPNPYPPYSGVLVFSDPLSNNSQGNNWEVYDHGVSACTFSGGAYHVRETQKSYFTDCFPDPNFANFTYQVQMQIIQGDCGGIIFRADSTHAKFYLFRVCQDGTYALLLYVDNTNANTQTLANGSNPAIHNGKGQTNTAAVVARGNELDLYVNQQVLTTVIDSNYSYGHIAVVAQDLQNPTEVVYYNAKVWRL